MADPASQLFFLAQVSSFFLSEVPKIFQASKEVWDAPKTLTMSLETMEALKIRMENWALLWGGLPLEPPWIYEDIWSVERYRLIKSTLADIFDVSGAIYRRLGVRPDQQDRRPPTPFRENLKVNEYLGLNLPGGRPTKTDMVILRRVSIAIKDKNTKKAIETLEAHISNLETFASSGHKLLRDVGHDIDTCKRLCYLSNFADELYWKCHRKRRDIQWTLLLSWPKIDPDRSYFKSLSRAARLDLIADFRVSRDNQAVKSRLLLRFRYDGPENGSEKSFDGMDAYDLVRNHYQSTRYLGNRFTITPRPANRPRGPTLRERLHGLPQPRSESDAWFEYDLAISRAFAVVTMWSLFLFDTQWFTHVCGCRIHENRFSRKADMAPYEAVAYQFRSVDSDNERHECHRFSQRDDTTGRLGALYSELTGFKISDVRQGQTNLQYHFIEGQRLYILPWSELEERINEAASEYVGEAAKYCLHSDREIEYILPAQREIHRRVLEPIVTHHRRTEKHFPGQ